MRFIVAAYALDVLRVYESLRRAESTRSRTPDYALAMTGETEHMREYAFGEFTRARVWIGALPDAKSTATQTLELIRWPSSQVLDNQVALAILDESFNKPAPPNPIHALQLACRQGASLLELIDLVHQECGASPYQRSLVTRWFFKTFEIGVRDVQELAAWEGFGDGA